MIGTGGNAGSQTVGTIIRGLALGEIQGSQTLPRVYREWLTGLLLGIAAGEPRLRSTPGSCSATRHSRP